MSSQGTLVLKNQAELFTIDELDAYILVGEAPQSFQNLFVDYVNEVRKDASNYCIGIIEGDFGMGKTLLIRKMLRFAIRNYSEILPVYIPLRGLATGVSTIENYLKKHKGVVKEPTALTKAIIYWLTQCKYFIGSYEWDIGKSIKGENKKRIEVLENIIKNNPSDLLELAKVIYDEGFIPLIVIDELEAFVRRGTRESPIIQELLEVIIEKLIGQLYSWLNRQLRAYGIIVLSSVLRFKPSRILEEPDWICWPLVEYAIEPSQTLEIMLRRLVPGVDRYLERINSLPKLEDRISEARNACKNLKTKSLLAQPELLQRLETKRIELIYRADDYRELIERAGLRITNAMLLKLFEYMRLSLRTLINIIIRLRSKSIEIFDYESLAQTIDADKCYDADIELKQRKVIPINTKWIKRTCGLLSKGIIALPRDIIPTVVNIEDLKGYYVKFLENLCEALEIRDRCVPWNHNVIEKIKQILNDIRLRWGAIKVVSIKGVEIYSIDETIVRVCLGDNYDILGNEVDLVSYFQSLIIKHKQSH